MRVFPVLAPVLAPMLASAFAVALLAAAPALADDDEFGAYLFKGSCDSFAPDAVVKDIGDLDREDDADKEWARVSPDHAQTPNPVYVEDESTDRVTAEELAAGGFAIAVTETDSPDSTVIACGELPGGMTLPFVTDLQEVDNSSIAGRVAIEKHRKGLKITTAAFAKESVPPLAR